MPRRHKGRSPLSNDPLYDPRTADAAVRFLESLSARRPKIHLPKRQSALDSNEAPWMPVLEGLSTTNPLYRGPKWMQSRA